MTNQEIEELERDPERAWRETGSKLRQTSLSRRDMATANEMSDTSQYDHGFAGRVTDVRERQGRH